MTANHHLLLITGSTRPASTNTATLRTAQDLMPQHWHADLYDRLPELPAFNPDDELPDVITDLRHRINAADAVVFCTPEYAGALPGSFKNLLDWTVGGSEMYGKPVAWITVAPEGRGVLAADSLRTVLTYLSTEIIEEACVRLPVARDSVGEDGTITDQYVRESLAKIIRSIAGQLP